MNMFNDYFHITIPKKVGIDLKCLCAKDLLVIEDTKNKLCALVILNEIVNEYKSYTDYHSRGGGRIITKATMVSYNSFWAHNPEETPYTVPRVEVGWGDSTPSGLLSDIKGLEQVRLGLFDQKKDKDWSAWNDINIKLIKP